MLSSSPFNPVVFWQAFAIVMTAWIGCGIAAFYLQRTFDRLDSDNPFPEVGIEGDHGIALYFFTLGFVFVLLIWPGKLAGYWVHRMLPLKGKLTLRQWFAGV